MLRLLRIALPAAVFALCACAQDRAFAPEWDIRTILKEISAHAGRVVTQLDKTDPAAWVAKGAPEAYAAQWKSAHAQAGALAAEALELSKDPEKLAPSLKTFFRMQSLEFSLGSLGEAIRRYQSPELANELAALAGENGANRERFQHYIVELAAQREQEYQIMDHEAQRCRSVLSRETPVKKTGRKSSK